MLGIGFIAYNSLLLRPRRMIIRIDWHFLGDPKKPSLLHVSRVPCVGEYILVDGLPRRIVRVVHRPSEESQLLDSSVAADVYLGAST